MFVTTPEGIDTHKEKISSVIETCCPLNCGIIIFNSLILSSDELMEEPVKRHSDAIFTDNYSRFRKQMAVKKYLNSVLTGKRR